MADNGLAEMIQKAAFYANGGQDPGNRDIDKINTTFATIGGAADKMSEIVKNAITAKKTALEAKKVAIENTPAADIVGTPMLQNDIRSAQNAPIPTADLVSGHLNARQGALDTAATNARAVNDKLGNLTVGQYKDMAEAQKFLNTPGETKEDLYPASKIMVFADAKKVLPGLTPGQYMNMTYGSLKQQIAAGKQTDLNANRNVMRDAARDTMVLNLRKSIDDNAFIKGLKEQNLGLETTDEISKLSSDGNTVAATALGIKEAKGLGEGGRMTDQDVVRYVRSGQIAQAAADKLLGWLEGHPSKATLDQITQINNVITDHLTKKLNAEYGKYVDLLANNFDITREEAARRLAIKLPQDTPLGTIGTPAPTGGGWDATKEKRYQELLNKKNAGKQ